MSGSESTCIICRALAECVADAVYRRCTVAPDPIVQRCSVEMCQEWRRGAALVERVYICAVAEERPEQGGQSKVGVGRRCRRRGLRGSAEALGLTPLSRAKQMALVTSTEVAGEGLESD